MEVPLSPWGFCALPREPQRGNKEWQFQLPRRRVCPGGFKAGHLSQCLACPTWGAPLSCAVAGEKTPPQAPRLRGERASHRALSTMTGLWSRPDPASGRGVSRHQERGPGREAVLLLGRRKQVKSAAMGPVSMSPPASLTQPVTPTTQYPVGQAGALPAGHPPQHIGPEQPKHTPKEALGSDLPRSEKDLNPVPLTPAGGAGKDIPSRPLP